MAKNISNKKKLKKEKQQLKSQIKKRILRYGNPRLQMLFIITVIVLVGFTSTALMAKFGIKEMYIRYPISIALAYGSFFLCLGIWVKLIISKEKYRIEIDADIIDLAERLEYNPSIPSGNSSSTSDSFFPDFAFDADEGIIFIILIILLLSLIIITGYFIVSAPIFFSEILLDAALGAGFYKKLKRIQADGWVTSAFKKTWLYFLIFLIIYTAGGYIIQSIDDKIITVGDAVEYIFKDKSKL